MPQTPDPGRSELVCDPLREPDDVRLPRYEPADDVGVVTAWFEGAPCPVQRRNLALVAATMRASGVPWVVAECALGGAPHALPAWMDPVRVRSASVLWHKERLLALAVARLPPRCTKVVWLDADVLFADLGWLRAASRALDRWPVVQPFSHAVRLPPGVLVPEPDDPSTMRWEAFASVLHRAPDAVSLGAFGLHGHTGFAWAARRELLARHGLYDACVAGRGDHLMAHAFAGEWDSACIERITGGSAAHRAHAIAWCERVYADVRARVGRLEGAALHLWHGEVAARGYQTSLAWLGAQRFDPAIDLRANGEGAWEWARDGGARSAWMRGYFARRRA